MKEIKNLKKVAERILKAIKDRERIIIYGDSDLDGTTSAIILKESIQHLGGKVEVIYFSNRETDGYGISEKALSYLDKFVPALLITVDCGIGNFEEVRLANKLGFEVIIIDHHQVCKLPEASIIINPKQDGDEYPFKELAAVGIVFKLSELLLGNQITEKLKEDFLGLTALATIADMMPIKEDNKIFIDKGLPLIKTSYRLGLQEFFKTEIIKNTKGLDNKVSKLISIVNIRNFKDGVPVSFGLLTCRSKEKSQEIVRDLFKESIQKQKKIKQIITELEQGILNSKDPIVFLGSADWKFSYISSLASIISLEHQKPTFIFRKGKKESQGAVRVPSNVNSVDLMSKCSDFLLAFGGHPKASGFRIKNNDLEKFKSCLIKNL